MTDTAHETKWNSESADQPGRDGVPPLGLVALIIFLLLCGYGFLVTQGIPQYWTERAIEVPTVGHHAEAEPQHPPLFMVAPFVLLLLSIAFLPLIPATAHWWESNLHKFYVAAGLGLVTLLYYGFFSHFTLVGHWPGHYEVTADKTAFEKISVIFMNAIVADFVPFIILLFSLFTITGGIRIEGNLKANPLTNAVILLIGAVLASFIGTTGAAMLLIRLLLETNRLRKYKVHTIVFFIFCVCNCGGCLTPLGDPPLFLGYLKGVAFEWTFNLWKEWAFVNGTLIGLYFLWDTVWYYPKESKEDRVPDNANRSGLKISGLALNLPLLLGVGATVAFLAPTVRFMGTDWHPWYFLREAIQLGLCAVSLVFGCRKIRLANAFNFAPIKEVAAVFFGIFICMSVLGQILNVESGNIVAFAEAKTGLEKPVLFFWSTGALSSVLDNAPTYVVFFETAKSLPQDEGVMVPVGNGFIEFYLLVAVSLGSVFMGAMTYIGNGPNFMVKAMAEQSGVKMPSFFGYMVYSCLILLPLFTIMTWLFS